MLEIFNILKPFFEDCYRRYSVREYAKILKLSPPTASKLLKNLNSEKLLKEELNRNYLFFWANRENKTFIDLSRIYWGLRLKEVTNHLTKKLINPTIILFGSLSKAENKIDSDVDLAVFSSKKKINLVCFEKDLKRMITVFSYESIKSVDNKDILNNIVNGHILAGRLRL